MLNVGKGKDATVNVNNITSEIPEGFKLHQNYPNPFNPVTNISFQLPYADNVTLKVYNIMGMEVDVLVNGRVQAGKHSVNWEASKFTSGVYFYTIVTGSFTESKKMLLIK